MNNLHKLLHDALFSETQFFQFDHLSLKIDALLQAKKGENIDAKDENGRTCLHQAVLNANSKLIILLLKKGASGYAQDNKGNTPLLLALQYHTVLIKGFQSSVATPSAMIACLVENNTDISTMKNNGGDTVQTLLAKRTDLPEDLVAKLIILSEPSIQDWIYFRDASLSRIFLKKDLASTKVWLAASFNHTQYEKILTYLSARLYLTQGIKRQRDPENDTIESVFLPQDQSIQLVK